MHLVRLLNYENLIVSTILSATLEIESLLSSTYNLLFNGGWYSILLSVIVIAFFVLPIAYTEYILGSKVGGIIKIYNFIPILKGFGFVAVVYLMINLPHRVVYHSHYLIPIHSSIFKYRKAFTSCDNAWNTDECRLDAATNITTDEYGQRIHASPWQEYFEDMMEDSKREQSVRLVWSKVIAFVCYTALLIPFQMKLPISLAVGNLICLAISIGIFLVIAVRAMTLPNGVLSAVESFNVWNFGIWHSGTITNPIYTMNLGIGIWPTLISLMRNDPEKKRRKWFMNTVVIILLHFIICTMLGLALAAMITVLQNLKGLPNWQVASDISFNLAEVFINIPEGRMWLILYLFAAAVSCLPLTATVLVVINNQIELVVGLIINESMYLKHEVIIKKIVETSTFGLMFVTGLAFCTNRRVFLSGYFVYFINILIYLLPMGILPAVVYIFKFEVKNYKTSVKQKLCKTAGTGLAFLMAFWFLVSLASTFGAYEFYILWDTVNLVIVLVAALGTIVYACFAKKGQIFRAIFCPSKTMLYGNIDSISPEKSEEVENDEKTMLLK